jgi:hypothetical protein
MGDNTTGGGNPQMYAGSYTPKFLECCASLFTALDAFMEPNGSTILDNSFVLFGTDLGTNHNGASVFYGMSKAGGRFKPGIYDVNGTLLAFLTDCKVRMGLPGTATLTFAYPACPSAARERADFRLAFASADARLRRRSS